VAQTKIRPMKEYIKIIVYRFSKLIGLFNLSRHLMKNRLLILCFHGFQLQDEADFRPKLFMREAVLLKRLEAIKRYGFSVIPLEVALRTLKNGTLPVNAVCLTIDDGFYSSLKVAGPLLHRYGLPATLYLTTYYSKKCLPVYRLVVQYMFWKTVVDNLDVSDQPWGTSASVPLNEQKKKDKMCLDIIDYGESRCCEKERQDICRLLGKRLEVSYEHICDSRILSLLTVDELRELKKYGVDIQLHTHRHHLSLDNEAEARREIRENREYIKKALGQEPNHFCYPSGIWNSHQWTWLKREGVISATTCEVGLNKQSTPELALYRVLDEDAIPQIEFEAALFGFTECIHIILGKRHRSDAARKRQQGEPLTWSDL